MTGNEERRENSGESTAIEKPEPAESEQSHRQQPQNGDPEGKTPNQYDNQNDPYHLSSRLKSPEAIEAIRANTSRKRDGFGPITLNKDATKARNLQKFYKNQNENIERLLKSVDDHVRIARETQGENLLKVKIAVTGSLVANLILAGLQIYAATTSLSLSLFTTMADALFDPLSNITLILSNHAVKHVDARKFPSGKARIETVGNIVFCFLMSTVSWILIVVSIIQLTGSPEPKKFELASTISVCVAFSIKFILFLYCSTLRKQYSQVKILWEDHRNDLFVNGFGILTSSGGAKLAWWIDPMGAIILSLLVSSLWLRTAYSEFQLLIGISADTEMLQWITYIAMTHSPLITAIDTVRAYHSGPRLVVEVDVVVDANETVKRAHDVAEELQVKLERLPSIERCYVHIDYETSHKPEHSLKKEL